MKQRITVEQLNELADEQKEKLREWWKPAYSDIVHVCNEYENKVCAIDSCYNDRGELADILWESVKIKLLKKHNEK